MPLGGAPGPGSGDGRLGGRHLAEADTEIRPISAGLPPPWR
ncbi:MULTISPECIES: hypothetical protein [unclassified Actinomadura]|nr:hypothetical protein [Actinomadura sp. K4S16]